MEFSANILLQLKKQKRLNYGLKTTFRTVYQQMIAQLVVKTSDGWITRA